MNSEGSKQPMADIWQGKRVRLRAVEPEDWETHFAWDHDSDMARRFEYAWFPPSQAHARQWADQTSQRAGAEGDKFAFEVEALADDALVGHIAVNECDPRVGVFSIGVATQTERRRQGYASEATLLVARYYFQELRYQKVNAQVHSYNTASLGLFDKLGFQREGVLRRVVYTGGRHHDMVAFGMTDEEFTALHPEVANEWRMS